MGKGMPQWQNSFTPETDSTDCQLCKIITWKQTHPIPKNRQGNYKKKKLTPATPVTDSTD